MSEWTSDLDRALRRLVEQVCDRSAPAEGRTAAWRELMIQISPHVEGWARRSRTLRRCRLNSEDDARGVLVAVLQRLAAHDRDVLRAFLEQRPPTAADELDGAETAAVERLVQLLSGDALDEPADPPASDDTPFRAWLLRVFEFAAKDHVRVRLGAGEGNKRALGSEAARLDVAPEPAARPPVTDLVTLRKVLDEIRAVMATFPQPMQQALALWAEDERFETIAARLALEGPDQARGLVRAATARLRERFRERFPSLVAS